MLLGVDGRCFAFLAPSLLKRPPSVWKLVVLVRFIFEAESDEMQIWHG